jgi:hypothetical protein
MRGESAVAKFIVRGIVYALRSALRIIHKLLNANNVVI